MIFLEYLIDNLDLVLTLTTLVVSIFLFLNNPIRRWRFFGYRPTLMAVLYDKKTKNILIVKEGDFYAFPQQTINSDNILFETRDLVKREVGIRENAIKVSYYKTLGTIKLTRSYNRKSDLIVGGISLRNKFIGKGYLVCFSFCNFSDKAHFNSKALEIDEIKILNYKEALKILKKSNPHKAFMYKIIKNELDKIASHNKNPATANA